MEKKNYKISDFKLVTEDKIRYSDTDRQGHVNNSIFNQFIETGRVEILYNPEQPLYAENCSFVIANLSLIFLSELRWPGKVKIGTRVKKIGTSSIVLEQGLFQNDNCAAFAETVIVHVNTIAGGAIPLTDTARSILEKLVNS